MSLQRRYKRANREILPDATPIAQQLYNLEDWTTPVAELLYRRRAELPRIWCDGFQFSIEIDGEPFAILKSEAVRLAAGEAVADIFGPDRKKPGRASLPQTPRTQTK